MHIYDLLAVDMDGTLLDSKKEIDPATVSDIEAASVSGKHIALCTGRGLAEIDAYEKELARVRFGVMISGALVYDFSRGEEIFRTGVRRAEMDRLISLARKYDGMLHFLTANESIVPVKEFARFEEYGMGIYRPLFEKYARKVTDMAAESQKYDFIEKINIYFTSSAIRDEARAELEAEGVPLEFANAELQSLESSPRGAGKGEGLQRLAEYLGIPLERVAAVGDMENDIPMFAVCGLPIAMGNAPDSIKALCREVVADNDHNGVGEAIRRFLLS